MFFVLIEHTPKYHLRKQLLQQIKILKGRYAVLALALGDVGSLLRASRFRGPHSSKKRALQAVDC